MPPRVSPLKDAIQHVVSKTDKTYKLEVKYINAVKGRGLFAASSICKGEFVVEYRGDLINDAESQRRRSLYHPSCVAFMFAFKWRGKMWCIDASRDDGSFGRLVNDDHRHPNCKMKRIDVNGIPHLCLFALNDIKEGQEITYDYGGEDCPWRTQMTTSTANARSADEPHPSPQSDAEEDDLPGPSSTLQKTTTSTANARSADEPHPSPQSDAEEDDLPGPSSTLQKMTTSTANARFSR
uniref:SET domain-containing protein n=1 Tax=Amphiprion ocellaris TaxID=80972 RepID=A0AAQ6AIE4_AMPOC